MSMPLFVLLALYLCWVLEEEYKDFCAVWNPVTIGMGTVWQVDRHSLLGIKCCKSRRKRYRKRAVSIVMRRNKERKGNRETYKRRPFKCCGSQGFCARFFCSRSTLFACCYLN